MSALRTLCVVCLVSLSALLVACGGGTRVPVKAKEPVQLSKARATLSRLAPDTQAGEFHFTVRVTNLGDESGKAFVIVYGMDDRYYPIRRGVWGCAAEDADLYRGYSRPEVEKAWEPLVLNHEARAECSLESGATQTLEGSLSLKGKAPDGVPFLQRSVYNKLWVSVFSERGDLLFENKYTELELITAQERASLIEEEKAEARKQAEAKAAVAELEASLAQAEEQRRNKQESEEDTRKVSDDPPLDRYDLSRKGTGSNAGKVWVNSYRRSDGTLVAGQYHLPPAKVHVRSYRRSDGTVVQAYERNYPGAGPSPRPSSSSPPSSSHRSTTKGRSGKR